MNPAKTKKTPHERKHEALRGRVVVIMGAASGFGRGGAVAFARTGTRVVLAARRGEVLQEVAEACEVEGADAMAVELDVADEAEISALAQTAIERFGRIDVWINNAGAGAIGRFDALALEDHVQAIETK